MPSRSSARLLAHPAPAPGAAPRRPGEASAHVRCLLPQLRPVCYIMIRSNARKDENCSWQKPGCCLQVSPFVRQSNINFGASFAHQSMPGQVRCLCHCSAISSRRRAFFLGAPWSPAHAGRWGVTCGSGPFPGALDVNPLEAWHGLEAWRAPGFLAYVIFPA